MSTTIDNRIVNMEFNNGQFESGVQESMSTLEKLKSALDFSNFGTSINNFEVAIDGLGTQFSALEQIAIGALRNIGSKLETTVSKIAGQLTTQQIAVGWQKYADIATASATIMNSGQGTTQEEVTDMLAMLNWYADSTSASLSDMTDNIGKFTAAGQSLDDSAVAIMGISNWAYESGQNVNAASRAMYNLAQALSAGSVKLIDYKSIQNANMDTREFRQTVIDTAAEMEGWTRIDESTIKSIDGVTVSVDDFTSSMSEGWFTSELLMQVLEQYGGNVSEIYEYATENVLTCAEAMEEMYEKGLISAEEIGTKSFEASMETKTYAEAINATGDAVSTAWTNIFTAIFGNYTEAKAVWSELSEILWNTFAGGVVALSKFMEEASKLGTFDMIIYGILDAWNQIYSMVEKVIAAVKALLPEFTALDFRWWAQDFRGAVAEGSEFSSFIESFGNTLINIINIVGTIGKTVTNILKGPVGTLFSEAGGFIRNLFSAIGENALGEVLTAITNAAESLNIEKISENLSKVSSAIVKIFNVGVLLVQDVLSAAAPVLEIILEISGFLIEVFAQVVGGIADWISQIADWLVENDRMANFFDKIKEKLETFSESIKTFLSEHGPEIESFIGDLLSGVGKVIDSVGGFIDDHQTEIENFFDTIGSAISNLVDTALPYLQRFWETVKEIVHGLFGSDSEVSTGSEPVLFEEFEASEMEQSSTSLSTGGKILESLGSIAESLLPIFEKLVNLISDLLPYINSFIEQASTYLSGVLDAISTITDKLANGEGIKASDIASLIPVIATIGTVLLAIKGLSKSSSDSGGGGILSSITGLIGGFGKIEKAAAGVLEAGKGLLEGFKIAVIMAGISLIIISIGQLMESLTAFAQLDSSQIGYALLGLTGIVAALVLLMAAMKLLEPSLTGAASVAILAGSLILLAGALFLLAQCDPVNLAVGLGVLAGAIVVLLVAAAIAEAVSVGLTALSVAFLAIGGAVALTGAGILMIATAIDLLTNSLLKFANVDQQELENICNSLIAIMSALGVAAVGAILNFLNTLAEAMPQIREDILVIVDEICTIIEGTIPRILAVPFEIINQFVAMLAEKAPELFASLLDIIVGFLEVLADKIPDFVQAGVDIIVSLIEGIVSAQLQLINAAVDAIIAFVNGIADTIDEKMPELIEAFQHLFHSIINAVISVLTASHNDMEGEGGDLIDKLLEAIKQKFDDIKEAGKDLIDGFIEGVKDKATAVWDAAVGVVEDAVDGVKEFLGIHSPSKLFAELGMYSDEGLANGLSSFSGVVSDSAEGVGSSAVDAMSDELSTLGGLLSDDLDSAPTIRPVLDLTDFSSSMAQMESSLYDRTLSVGSSASYASSSLGRTRYEDFKMASQNVAGGLGTSSIVINVYGAEGQDVSALADAISERLNNEINRKRAVFV